MIKDPETYERFEKIVLLHGCRRVKELAYGEIITVTRDPFRNRGRIPT